MEDSPVPLYGDGLHVRDWLYVEDHCRALDLLLERGEPGEIYNIGGGELRTNLGEHVDRVTHTDEVIVIARRNKPRAVLISWERYQAFERALDLFEDEFDRELIEKRMGDESVSFADMLERME